jgi:putative lipoprotein
VQEETTDPTSAESSPTAESDPVVVRGSVTYRERMMLPGDATVTVRVEDVSLADGPAVLLAEEVLTDVGAPPYPFELSVDRAGFDERARPSVRVRIEVDGELWMVSDTTVPVVTHGAPTHVEIVVVSVPRRRQ